MMFLSGVYFTLDAAPKWLQDAVVVLPLSPYIKALRGIFNDGAGPGRPPCWVWPSSGSGRSWPSGWP